MSRTAVIVGVGPGLGMSIAHRFGREGFTPALVSRSGRRHVDYVRQLADAGIEAETYVADASDRDQLRTTLDRIGPADLVYFGAAMSDLGTGIVPLDKAGSEDVRPGMEGVYSAIDLVKHTLPGMLDRGAGAYLFAGGLSAVQPMPMLGSLAVTAAALRNYVLTLNATIADKGLYAANLIIGGLIERGDIHDHVMANAEQYGQIPTLNPDDIADTAWDLYTRRDRAEEIFSAFS
ncbi:SDR family NAD(P)-dependent oxidoreductase [Kibdelosporangium lantanae]